MPDSKYVPDFFCSSCQTHKVGRLLSHKIKNRSYCTACLLPKEKRKEMGITSPYEKTAVQRATIKQAPKSYKKSLSDQTLYAITGENNAKSS